MAVSAGTGPIVEAVAICPATGKHCKRIDLQLLVAGDTSYTTGGETIPESILAQAGIRDIYSITQGWSFLDASAHVLTPVLDGGVWKLKSWRATGNADDTPVEIDPATNLSAAQYRVSIYGV